MEKVQWDHGKTPKLRRSRDRGQVSESNRGEGEGGRRESECNEGMGEQVSRRKGGGDQIWHGRARQGKIKGKIRGEMWSQTHEK